METFFYFHSRLLTFMAGFGNDVWTKNDSFFWIPWLVPHVGGVIGSLVYMFMVEIHHDDDDDD